MKWIWSAALFAAGCAVLNAQEGTPSKMAHTRKATYTGCIEDFNAGGSFVLTHVEGDQMMSRVVTLTGRSDLKKHVGQKVMVAGALSHGMAGAMPIGRDTLALTSLKVVAKSCS